MRFDATVTTLVSERITTQSTCLLKMHHAAHEMIINVLYCETPLLNATNSGQFHFYSPSGQFAQGMALPVSVDVAGNCNPFDKFCPANNARKNALSAAFLAEVPAWASANVAQIPYLNPEQNNYCGLPSVVYRRTTEEDIIGSVTPCVNGLSEGS
eukprot:gene18973-907_t